MLRTKLTRSKKEADEDITTVFFSWMAGPCWPSGGQALPVRAGGVQRFVSYTQEDRRRLDGGYRSDSLVEPRGIEPLTSWLPAMRSPS